MKRISLFITITFLLVFQQHSFAQNYHPVYEDDYLGWIKTYHYKGATKPLQVDEKKYSIAQLSIADSFANWMQASYTPKGGLGDIIKYVTRKKNVYAERYNEALPHSYGASAVTYLFLKKVSSKWVPENNLGHYWNIGVNQIPYSFRELAFNTNETCLFILPFYDDKKITDNTGSDNAKAKKLYDLSTHPSLKKYIQYNLNRYREDFGHNMVILSKNNRNPFLPVTIGEALTIAATAFPVKYAEEKKTTTEQNSYDAAHLALAMKTLNEKYDKAKATIAILREKYANRLKENAYLKYGGYSIQDLANGTDIFTNGQTGSNGSFDKSFPLFKVDPEIQALCKTDQPQWIMIYWYGGMMDEPPFKHLHESIVNNFDFDYVYNFFFDREKVKGKKYLPLRSPVFEEKITFVEKSAEAKKLSTDAAVFYFEDFSSTPLGQKPIGWKSELNTNAKPAMVVEVKERKEKWLEIKGQYFVYPQNIPTPLPQNFELSFDLAVPKDIPWGAKALEFYLGTKNKYDENAPSLNLRFRAGFYGRAGEGSLTGKFGNGYFNSYKNFEATGFSNDKELNNVTITLKKNGELFELLIDDNKVAEIQKAFPAYTVFNWLQFKHLNSDAENQKYFISKFKIIRR
jgi:hypothetical protein